MRKLMFLLMLVSLGTLAFAGGQSEQAAVDGTVTNIALPAEQGSDMATVTLQTSDGSSYTLQLEQSTIRQLGLQVGTSMSAKGSVDGNEVEVKSAVVDGKTFRIENREEIKNRDRNENHDANDDHDKNDDHDDNDHDGGDDSD